MSPTLTNPTLIDTSSLQYAPWRAWLIYATPNPQVEKFGFRPPGWGEIEPVTSVQDPDGKYWFFDAVMRLDHGQSQRVTQHPVQTGANITDHSFSLPAQLTLEIGMSDVMDSYDPGQWTTILNSTDELDIGMGGAGESATGTVVSPVSKSVAAYEKLLDWKNHGSPLLINTRLGGYGNMVITNINVPDDVKTLHGLKCSVTFQQIFTSSIEKQVTCALPQEATTTEKGPIPVVTDNPNKTDTKKIFDKASRAAARKAGTLTVVSPPTPVP